MATRTLNEWQWPRDLRPNRISPRAARMLFDACLRARLDLGQFRPGTDGTLWDLNSAIEAVLEDDGWHERHPAARG